MDQQTREKGKSNDNSKRVQKFLTFSDEANAWTNLMYSCNTCNRSKGTEKPFDNISGKRRLINPRYSRIDPEKHIDFKINGAVILYKERKGSFLGKNTISNLKLKIRHDIYSILRKCQNKIDALFGELIDALVAQNDAMVNSRINDLSKKTSANEPHAAFCRKYLSQKINTFNNDERQLINQEFNININPITIYIASGSIIIN